MPFAWTPAALDDLHRLYIGRTLSAAKVARAIGGGLTRNAVLGKVHRLGWIRHERPKSGRKPSPNGPKVNPRRVNPPRGGPFCKVLPLPKLREIAVIGTPRPWTERGERECAFPVGEPAEPGRQFSCCAPVKRGKAYCPAHWKLMTLGQTALSEQEIEIIVEIARRAA